MDKTQLLKKLNKFCPAWMKRGDASQSIDEILQQTIGQVLPGLLHIKIEYLDGQKITGSVPYSRQTANVLGYMHGGTIFTLGDTLAGAFLWSISEANQYAVTTRSEIKYLKPVKEGILKCTVTEKSRSERKVTLEAIFEMNGQTIGTMTVDYLLMTAT